MSRFWDCDLLDFKAAVASFAIFAMRQNVVVLLLLNMILCTQSRQLSVELRSGFRPWICSLKESWDDTSELRFLSPALFRKGISEASAEDPSNQFILGLRGQQVHELLMWAPWASATRGLLCNGAVKFFLFSIVVCGFLTTGSTP